MFLLFFLSFLLPLPLPNPYLKNQISHTITITVAIAITGAVAIAITITTIFLYCQVWGPWMSYISNIYELFKFDFKNNLEYYLLLSWYNPMIVCIYSWKLFPELVRWGIFILEVVNYVIQKHCQISAFLIMRRVR